MSKRINAIVDKSYCRIELGDLTLHFSYQTLIGYHDPEDGRVASEDLWSTTTGKHLNFFSDKEDRLPREVFEQKVEAMLKRRGL